MRYIPYQNQRFVYWINFREKYDKINLFWLSNNFQHIYFSFETLSQFSVILQRIRPLFANIILYTLNELRIILKDLFDGLPEEI